MSTPIRKYSDALVAKAEFRRRYTDDPNVTGVAIGFKFVHGSKTSKIALNVLVKEKISRPKQAYPSEINGYPVDISQESFEGFKLDL